MEDRWLITEFSLNVVGPQYDVVGEQLLRAVKEVLKDAASPKIVAAWGEAYGALAKVFIDVEVCSCLNAWIRTEFLGSSRESRQRAKRRMARMARLRCQGKDQGELDYLFFHPGAQGWQRNLPSQARPIHWLERSLRRHQDHSQLHNLQQA